jgi:Holliday junction resolvasome RuvABC endonuclease subunit
MRTSYLLALDLSLNRPGYAVLSVTPRTIKIAECGHLAVDTSLEHGGRLRQIREWIAGIVERYASNLEPVFVKEEAPQTFSGHILQKSHGVAEEVLADFRYIDYPNTTIKLVIGGSGKAEKADVEKGVREFLGLPASFIFATDDESDAVAVGLLHLALTDRLPSARKYDELRTRVAQWREGQKRGALAKARRQARMRERRKKFS